MFSFSKIWKYFWPQMRKYKTSLFLTFIFYAIGVVADNIAKPFIYKSIVDNIVSAGTPSPTLLDTLLFHILLLIASIATLNLGYRIGDYLNSFFQSKVMKDLHDMAFKNLLNHSYAFFSNNFSGGIVAKTKRLANGFEKSFDVVAWQLWFSFISVVGIIVMLFFQAPILSLIFLIWALLYIFMTAFFVKKKIYFDMQAAAADSKVTGYLADAITNIMNVKTFSQAKMEREQFALCTEDEELKRRKEWNYGNLQNFAQAILIGILQVVAMYMAIKLWNNGVISVGTIVLLQAYMVVLFETLWGLGRALTKAMQALTEVQEIVDIFEKTLDILDPTNPEISRIKNGHIVFDNITFEYVDDHGVFTDFYLDIKPGERIGLVGHSGAGKSTITKLLLRFADVKKGAITIDGQDVRNITQDDLRKMISYVPQESLLFHRTIRENISYGRLEATEEEIFDVAKNSHAHEFISKLPKGYDTLVGERGVKLSGGERQRIAISRAMLKNAPILILDEATSSLDSVSEQYIRESFNVLMNGKTTIVIAHRLSTIQKMDRIVVLENGAIVEEGTHAKLLAKNGVYPDLWNHQVGGFIE